MSKRWRIEVSALGSDEPSAEATVEAANWMTALKAGRTALGESGGLPRGANLRHESGGAVTIHDARERKTYRLFPTDSIPPPDAPAAPAKRERPKTIAYIPSDDFATALSGAAAFAPTKPAPVPPNVEPVVTAPAAPAAAPPPEPQPGMPAPRKKKAMTMAYIPDADRPPAPKPVVVADQAMADTVLDGLLPAAPAPALSPAPAAPSHRAEDPLFTEVDVELLLARDAEPSAQNPLRYRERAYVVPATLTQTEAEAVARGELETLQAELEPFPTGKYVSIAVFDHVWDEQPIRPPIVTLDWKDWHGDAVVAFPLAAQPQRPLSVPPGPRLDPSERLSAAFEACQDLLFLERPIDALEFAVRLLSELLPTDATIASVYDIDTDQLRATSVLNADAITGRAARAHEGLMGVAAQDAAVALVVHDLAADKRFVSANEGVPGLMASAAVYMAISRHGRLYGMLQLFRRGEPKFTRNDAELVRYVGEQVGEFMAQFKVVQARTPRS